MVQIFGKILSNKKKVNVALQNISGLNNCQIMSLCNELNVGLDCKITDLSQSHIIKLLKLLVIFNIVVTFIPPISSNNVFRSAIDLSTS